MSIYVKSGFSTVPLDFAIIDNGRGLPYERNNGSKKPVLVSVFDRSYSQLRALTASVILTGNIRIGQKGYEKEFHKDRDNSQYRYKAFYLDPVFMGYEKFTPAILIHKDFKKDYIICGSDLDQLHGLFYDYLMTNYDMPLMKQWSPYLLNRALSDGMLQPCCEIMRDRDGGTSKIDLYGKKIPLDEIKLYRSHLTLNWLEETVKTGCAEKSIYISQEDQSPLLFQNMNDYFSIYGESIVDNLKKQVVPLIPTKHNVENLALTSKWLLPQQAACVNGIVALLRNSNYSIQNQGMGTGKSLQSLAAVETYFVEKYLRSHPGKTLKDAYASEDTIGYRIVIMGPGHLLEKWKSEAKEIPYTKVFILDEFKQLVEIKENGKERKGREIYIIGKDFCKLSYSFIPIPYQLKNRKGVSRIACCNCRETASSEDYRTKKPCIRCGGTLIKEKTNGYQKGLICPTCGELLQFVNGTAMQPSDFAVKNDKNLKCQYCGGMLWTANVRNIDCNSSMRVRDKSWYKVSHYTNKAKKGKTTSWVLRGHEEYLYKEKGLMPNEVEPAKNVLLRKVAPASYIKKHMKGFFDMAIFDECHQYKGGDTAQGNAMHSLVVASKKQLCLTGTISGGYAHHLYWLMWRLDPRKMQKLGFNYNGEMDFVKKYGTIETLYDIPEGTAVHNTASRGRKITEPGAKPGISPLVYRDFLLEKSVMLDLSDMSNQLPKLIENVITVPLDEDVKYVYNSVLKQLKTSGGNNGLNPLTSAMLQFSLSYPDKPYGYGRIINPKTGAVAAEPEEFDYSNTLLAKEEKLVDIINQEQSEGRNLFVFCEYTGDGNQNISYRLKDVIERNCNLAGKVAVLESSNPLPCDREAWIHKKAAEGIRVVIANPRTVETGLDFIFKHEGQTYNYPSIVFFQLGYNLFTIMQACRRHYRLIQKEECRTYYLAYSGTVQEKVIELIAEKQVCASALSGKFSSEGLSAMANGVDARLKLIQAMVDNTYESDNSEAIKGMFDLINKANNSQNEEFSSMKGNVLISELLGYEPVEVEELFKAKEINVYPEGEMFDYFSFAEVEMPQEDGVQTEENSLFGFELSFEMMMEPILSQTAVISPENGKEHEKPLKRKQKGILDGQEFLIQL